MEKVLYQSFGQIFYLTCLEGRIEEWEVGNLVHISFDNKENGTTKVVDLLQFTIIFLLCEIGVHYCMYIV